MRVAPDMITRMKNRIRGFTLIELMVGIMVLAILVGFAVPSFRSFAIESRISAASAELVTALNLARSEALRRSNLVRVCASADQATCSASTDWATGWIVFADTDGNGSPSAAELVQAFGAVQGGVSVSSTVPTVTYNGLGMATSAATFTTTHTHCSGKRARQSVLSLTGSLQTTKIDCPA